jgi:4,5:9,10-diseco-3-hydroxy-5,9,17-trioxoandrosta-1(10),2-diene-4-oate hydrolase
MSKSELTADKTSRFVQVGDLRIHYHEAGEGPVLLAIHGGAPGAYGWGNFGPNLPALADRFRTLIVDLPGFGKSDKPVIEGGRYTFYAEAFEQMLDALAIEHCHIIGLATGAATGLMMALRQPKRVNRMVLASPPAGPGLFQPRPSEGAKIIMSYYGGEGPTREKMRRYLETIIFDKSRITEELLDERYQISIDPDFMATAPEGRDRHVVVEPLWQSLDRIQAPTLLVWGRENRVVGFDVGLFMLSQMPNAHLNIYGRTGLWAPWEQLEKFNADVIAFLGQ